MADTNTTNLNLIKPEIGGAEDTWGVSINSDLDALDAIFSATGTEIDVRFNSANFDDNKKAIFGTGDDLQIYHDGSDSVIKDAGTGNLKLQASSFVLNNSGDTQNIITGVDGSFVRLFHAGSAKLETTSTGVDVTGVILSANNNTDDTNKEGHFLARQYDSGTETEGFQILQYFSNSSENRVDLGGASSAYNAATSVSFYTAANTTTRTGTERARIDSSGNLLIGKTTSNIATDGVELGTRVESTADGSYPLRLNRRSSDGDIINLRKDNSIVGNIGTSASSTYYGGSSNGAIYINGQTDIRPWDTSSQANLDGSMSLGSTSARFADLHLSGAAYTSGITTSSGDLTLDAAGDIILDADGGDIRFKDAGTEIGALENSSSDLQIKASVQDKDIIFRGNDGGSGINALTLDMSNNGRAVFNAGAGFFDHVNFSDNAQAVFGDGDDLKIYHDGSHSFISETGTGNLKINADSLHIKNASDNELKAYFDTNGGVGLYHDNVQKFVTTSTGVTVTDNLTLGSDSVASKINILGDVFTLDVDSNGNTGGTPNMRFAISGSEKARIDSSGRLLLNSTSTSFNDFLYVNGDAYTTGGWRVGSSATYVGKMYNNSGKLSLEADGSRDIQFGNSTNSDILYIDTSAQNIGIGTSSPDAPLTVHNSSDPEIRFGYSSTQDHKIAWDSSKVFIHADPENANGSSALGFAVDGSEAARFDASGNLGIGTSSPGSLLTVEGDIRQTSGDFLYGGGGNWDIKHLADDQNIVFYTSESGSATEKMRIKANGAVGIGTSSPSASHKLTVGGDTKFTGQLSILDNQLIKMGDGEDFAIYHDTSAGNVIKSNTSDMDIVIQGNDGGSTITALTLDMSNAGAATFNGNLTVNGADVTITSNIIHAGDSDTYFGFNDANTFRIVTGGSEALRVDSSQRVGIGTTSPSEKLEVAGKIKTGGQVRAGSYLEGFPSFSFANDTDTGMFSDTDNQLEFSTGGSSRLSIDSSGNLGINTSSPSSLLHLGGSTNKGVEITSSTANAGYLAVFQDQAIFSINRDGSDGSFADTSKAAAVIKLNSAAADSNIEFQTTTTNNASPTTRLTIDKNGNVGIGTSSPTDKLTVAGDITVSGSSPEVTFQTGASHYNWQIAAQESTNSAFEIAVGSADGDASNDSFSALMTVLQSGNVGIGTSSPDNTLHIHKGTAGSVTGNTNAPLTVENSTNNFLQMLAPNANESGILFGNPTNAANAGIVYSGSNGDLQFRNAGNTERMRIDSSGEIHVNKTATVNNGQFEVLAQANHQAIVAKVQTNAYSVFQGFNASGSAVFIATGAGNLTITGTLSEGSDITLKENIKPLNNQLEIVKKLNPVTFDWKEDKKPYQQIGFIAQEVEKHLPELIEDKDDIKRMSYGNMTAVLVKAIQEQQDIIEDLQTQLNKLKR